MRKTDFDTGLILLGILIFIAWQENTFVSTRFKIWPRDMRPTRIVRIPCPEFSNRSVIQGPFVPGDDIEIDFSATWVATIQGSSPTMEISINDGRGFQPLEDYQKAREQNAGTNSWWSKPRVARLRIRPGAGEKASLAILVEKMDFEYLPGFVPQPEQF